MPSGEDDSTQDDAFNRIARDYYEAAEDGQTPDEESLVRQHPEFEQQLRSFFADLRELRRLPGASVSASTNGAFDVGTSLRYFGDYEIVEEISRGGMGVVFKARQLNLDRIVALKMILAGELATQKDVDRFYAEAEAAAQLDHPGIVPIHEIGQHDGRHYFSMAYVDGENLASKAANGPLPTREAARLMLGICDAIAYAHDHGVIHRDLKPSNVLIDSSGNTRVTDFGLAKRLEVASDLTQTGQVLGTPAYMPPEQAAGRVNEIGPLSDVYSLGAILYFLLTGRPPYQSANPIDTLQQVLNQDLVEPRLLNASVATDIQTICLKCLRENPAERYGSVREFADDISRFLRGEPIEARPLGIPARLFKWYSRNVEFVAPVAITATYVILTLVTIGGVFADLARSAIVAHESVAYLDLALLILQPLLTFSIVAFLSRAAWNGKLYGVILNTLLAMGTVFMSAQFLRLLANESAFVERIDLLGPVPFWSGMLLWSLLLLAMQIHSLIVRCAKGIKTDVENEPRVNLSESPSAFGGITKRLRAQLRLGLESRVIFMIFLLSTLLVSAAVLRRVMRESFGVYWGRNFENICLLWIALIGVCSYILHAIVTQRRR